MRSAALINALKSKFGVDTDQALAKAIGLSSMTLNNWRNKGALTPRMMADLVNRLATPRTLGQPIIEALKKKLR